MHDRYFIENLLPSLIVKDHGKSVRILAKASLVIWRSRRPEYCGTCLIGLHHSVRSYWTQARKISLLYSRTPSNYSCSRFFPRNVPKLIITFSSMRRISVAAAAAIEEADDIDASKDLSNWVVASRRVPDPPLPLRDSTPPEWDPKPNQRASSV